MSKRKWWTFASNLHHMIELYVHGCIGIALYSFLHFVKLHTSNLPATIIFLRWLVNYNLLFMIWYMILFPIREVLEVYILYVSGKELYQVPCLLILTLFNMKVERKRFWCSVVPHLRAKSAPYFFMFPKVQSESYGICKTPVYLNVYDLTPINSYVYWAGFGVFHTGLEGVPTLLIQCSFCNFSVRSLCCCLVLFEFCSMIRNSGAITNDWASIIKIMLGFNFSINLVSDIYSSCISKTKEILYF